MGQRIAMRVELHPGTEYIATVEDGLYPKALSPFAQTLSLNCSQAEANEYLYVMDVPFLRSTRAISLRQAVSKKSEMLTAGSILVSLIKSGPSVPENQRGIRLPARAEELERKLVCRGGRELF
jgi:hypothetical protein